MSLYRRYDHLKKFLNYEKQQDSFEYINHNDYV